VEPQVGPQAADELAPHVHVRPLPVRCDGRTRELEPRAGQGHDAQLPCPPQKYAQNCTLPPPKRPDEIFWLTDIWRWAMAEKLWVQASLALSAQARVS